MTTVSESSTQTQDPPAPTAGDPPGFRAGFRATWRIWLGSRIVVALISYGASNALGSRSGNTTTGFIAGWDRWDVGLYTKVARDGYFSPKYPERTEVDFPGLPLLLRALHWIIPNWVAAGLVVSLLAGLASSAALWSLAARERPDDPLAGTRAVLAMVLFPYAVFLFAGYSEGLFLAGASCAWLAARQRRWALAGLCACLSTSSRSIGIALVAALAVQYLVTERRIRASAGWLFAPVAPLFGYLLFLRVRTGHWDAYTRAQSYWHRTTALPWDGFRVTWHAAFDGAQASAYQVFWWAEIVAGFVGLLLTIVLLAERRWGEATYVGACTLILASSSYWDAGVRAMLVSFPFYLWLSRHRRIGYGYALIAAPFMVVFVVAFTQGSWVD
jgi:Gpi18-like mannosyltransferase